MEKSTIQAQELVITPENLYAHWQGHRRLTRKVIEAFPEERLFDYSVGGMRSFGELAMEMINIAGPGVYGILTGKWETPESMKLLSENFQPKTKEELLKLWDEVTQAIDDYWPKIPAHRFQEEETCFGQYDGIIYQHLFYFIDNEIHHRGQGYVYLRSLGIEPPFFWERT